MKETGASKICIYHGGCTDGVASAWCMWRRYPETDFYAGVYQRDPDWEKIAGADVYLVDFSYKRSVIDRLRDVANSVTVLDHHKTARDDLESLLNTGEIGGVFDMDRCGALIAWEHFNHAEQRPLLLGEIDAQDRWLASRDPQLILALRSYPHSAEAAGGWEALMGMWSWFMTDYGLKELRNDGASIHRYYRARVEETKLNAAPMDIGGLRNAPVVNAPYYLASDVAGELAADAPDGVAACWWQNRDGSVTFSLRSRGEVDVGELATQYGGGGHPGAAGFSLPSLKELAGPLGHSGESARCLIRWN
jgi:uncharacterized protein